MPSREGSSPNTLAICFVLQSLEFTKFNTSVLSGKLLMSMLSSITTVFRALLPLVCCSNLLRVFSLPVCEMSLSCIFRIVVPRGPVARKSLTYLRLFFWTSIWSFSAINGDTPTRPSILDNLKCKTWSDCNVFSGLLVPALYLYIVGKVSSWLST